MTISLIITVFNKLNLLVKYLQFARQQSVLPDETVLGGYPARLAPEQTDALLTRTDNGSAPWELVSKAQQATIKRQSYYRCENGLSSSRPDVITDKEN